MNSVVLGGSVSFIGKTFQSKNGNDMLTFGIGTKKNVKGKDYFDSFEVLCYGSIIEYVNKYLGKGDYVIVTGSLSTRLQTAQDGTQIRKYTIIANDVESVRKAELSAQEAYKKESDEDGYVDMEKAANGGGSNVFETVTDDDLPF
jgi:single-stranded DNA-binding protein